MIRAASDVEPRRDDTFYSILYQQKCVFVCVCVFWYPLTSYSKTIGRGGGFYFLGDRVVSSTFVGTLIIPCSIGYLKVS